MVHTFLITSLLAVNDAGKLCSFTATEAERCLQDDMSAILAYQTSTRVFLAFVELKVYEGGHCIEM